MSLLEDLERILDVVVRDDPSFRAVGPSLIEACIKDARRNALAGSEGAFLLSTMRLLALPENGHTRLIPNDAISVLPFRFVAMRESVFLTKSEATLASNSISKLIAVNGTPVDQIEAASQSYLAGTWQRKRVIGPLLLSWPRALAHLGFASTDSKTDYLIQDSEGRVENITVDNSNTIPALQLYPRNEHGQVDPVWAFDELVDVRDWQGIGISVSLPSFLETEDNRLAKSIAVAATRLRTCASTPLLIDVRGNTGGDFIKTLPLIDAIAASAQSRHCAVLVDKFTFSAAIVFVAILKHRLGRNLILIGEEMGDGLKFFAEGGSVDLPCSGAVVRYSTALHDWATGSIDQTTPPEIAEHILEVGKLEIDHQWTVPPQRVESLGETYLRILRELN
ncbi:peptidase S41 [Ruegeria sp. EL01]|uniref:peptidase S41 n=1 Tax=Ruegeria sp. EL01 TaxID=2107578 RepID=UPI000EA833BF|nr:peptidase S41 [Ruegeria sp. EL01]